jgi:carboxyl-terminal processing protease
MQDYGRALVVGEPTFGKGTVQNLIDLNRFDRSSDGKLGQLKTTIAQFFRVNGQSTQNRGIEPDIILPTVVSIKDHGESSLENALPWTSIRPAYYTPLEFEIRKIDKVRQLHEKRIATDPAFIALLETEQAIFDAGEKTEVSLLESDRIAEYESIRTEQLKRENQIRQAQGLAPLSALRGEEERSKVENDEEELMDVVLKETGRILADYIGSGLK